MLQNLGIAGFQSIRFFFTSNNNWERHLKWLPLPLKFTEHAQKMQQGVTASFLPKTNPVKIVC